MEMCSGPRHLAANQTMKPIKGEQLLTQLNWRYAVKQFDPTRKISPVDWAILENALILSASSWGLQPWAFVVITDEKTREKLFPSTWNQRQILDCSHYVVFTVKTKMTEEHIDRHIARTVELLCQRVEHRFRRRRQFTYVARISKVVDKTFAVHLCFNGR